MNLFEVNIEKITQSKFQVKKYFYCQLSSN